MVLDEITSGHGIGPLSGDQVAAMKEHGWIFPVVARDPWHCDGKQFPADFRTDLASVNKGRETD